MSDPSFVHLHVHTEYSLLDGLSKIPRLVDRAKTLGMPALAITDHGTMFGVMDFYNACRKAGIKPIIGLEGYLAPRTMRDKDSRLDRKPYHLLMLAKNQTGYRNLLKIASAGQLEGYYYNPRIDREFLEKHSEGLVVTSGCLAAQIPSMVMNGREDEARALIDWYLQVFGKDNFFLELQEHNIDVLRPVNEWLVDIGRRDDVRFVATCDVHYIEEGDYDPHDTLLCIQSSALKSDANRLKMSDNSYYLYSAEQMWQTFGHINDGEPLKNTLLIAEMCDIDLDRKGYHLPLFPVPEGHDAASFLRHLGFKGLRWRYGDDAERDPALRERLDYELTVIHNMGFDTYFLIVWDLCQFARHADIWWNVRGSGAGSITAYCLGITNIDPIQNNLLFERFLNPGRVSMPDIDMDFPDDRRGEMIEYTARKYGEDKVAAIITFGTLGAKAAVRDVGRALGVSQEVVNLAAKLIPTEPKPKPVKTYVEENPELQRLVNTTPELQKVIDTAAALQGVSRHASTHAAGVIVADRPLVEYIPLHRLTKISGDSERREEGDDESGTAISALKQVTQFPMETCEAIGLLKIDFLGLSTLTIVRRACDLIERHHGIRYTMESIPYRPTGDPVTDRMLQETFELIGRGETVGVFQVESSGMQATLRGMRPRKFEHIIAAISLYRPGPMEYIPEYNDRMHGRKQIHYHHEKLKPILEETFGIITYQEQIMQIASAMFGYKLGDADLMRRAVSKKKKEDLHKHRAIFLERGPENGVDVEAAGKIFDDIEYFANYGFNKSHAADYAVITVQSAFLKTHYPEAYMAALLSVYHDDATKVTTFLNECKRLNIPILPPDINHSILDFDIQPQTDGRRGIRYGLAAVKNAGAGAIQPILAARDADGPFADLEDLCSRVDLRLVGKRALESLIKVGALSALGERQQLINALERMVSYSAQQHRAKDAGQMSMFGGAVDAGESDLLTNLPTEGEASSRQMLDWEKELLGAYISSHPIDPAMETLRQVPLNNTYELKEAQGERQDDGVRLVGLIAGVRKIATKNKDMMAVVQLEDRFGTIDAVLFPRTWGQFETMVNPGAVVLVAGKLDLRRGEAQIICENVTQNFSAVMADSAAPSYSDALPAWMTPEPEDAPWVEGEVQAEPPGFDALPPWAPEDVGPAAPVRTVVVYLARSDNPDRDRRRLRRVHGLLTQYAGDDHYAIVIEVDGEWYELEYENPRTLCCDDLIRELRKVVGEGNVEVYEEANER